ncbi:NAD kinase [Sanguibacter gelidistatuariae]|uniref:NAD kinase n=1 Tax=Sanguibacter gelidistatuariae TaxID=1814289 RepID=A0A1G6GQ29_9MICO|nr:NAD(+)/NADH kinase [Sanguibacter gelidistatuariae]SDB83923.1 NAD kinase [Sanguibacter gelidistatuariae]
MTLQPRAVIVRRRTELDELVERHGTRGQVEFFLRTRGRTLAEVQDRHDLVAEALARASAAVPLEWRRAAVDREDLDRFLVDPLDVVVVVGQDGLVANVAKYLDGQPVIGVNPDPRANAGVLVRHAPADVAGLLVPAATGQARTLELTMAAADLDDGQHLDALNEIFVGHPTHQSARYRVRAGATDAPWERQSSSGLVVATGTGVTGWCASIVRERGHNPGALPAPDDAALAWFVREAWPSVATGTSQTEGLLAGEALRIVVESESLVVFGDGMENDRLTAAWGQEIRVSRSSKTVRLVVGAAVRP